MIKFLRPPRLRIPKFGGVGRVILSPVRFVGTRMNSMVGRLSGVEKRVRFVISTLIMSGLMLVSTFFFYDARWVFLPVLAVCAYIFTFVAVNEDVEGVEWFTLFLMPVLCTIVFYLFYFLIPIRWLTRVPFTALYAISYYALLLTSNILNISVDRSLRLYKAAFSTNYLFQTVITFLFFSVIFSARTLFFLNGFFVMLVIFPLILQLLWSIRLELSIHKQQLITALFVSVLLGQVSVLMSFVPFRTSVSAMMLSAIYYAFSGLLSAHLDNRLFKSTVREYVVVVTLVALVSVFSVLDW